jgi:hypothetical protein
MKKLTLLFIIFSLFKITSFSQVNHFKIKMGTGYYMDTFTTKDGPIIWLEGGYSFKTGFLLSGRLSMASIDYIIREGAFKDYRTILLRQMVDMTFSRPIIVSGQHYIEPGVGFKLKKEYLLQPDVIYLVDSGNYFQYTSYSETFYEIGLDISIDYYYQFNSGFFMGFRADTNVIWALGFEGLTLSPLFGFRF